MANFILYMVTVLIWGSTWLAIKYQLGVVSFDVSIAYRFALAAGLLLLFCVLTKKSLRFSLKDHFWMALLGFCLFSTNYFFMYWASGHITTGLVSVGFCSMVVMNIILSRVFFGTVISNRVVIGAGLGMVGIAMVFAPEMREFDLSDAGVFGLILVLCGTFFASLGNMVSTRNQKKGLPVMQANGWGMMYGAIFMAVFALVRGNPFVFDTSFDYLWSLAYLAVFGSVVAFGCYLTLLGRIGPEKAVYSIVLFPLVALTLSTLYEGYHWPQEAVIGVPLVLWGNVLVLTKSGQVGQIWRRLARAG